MNLQLGAFAFLKDDELDTDAILPRTLEFIRSKTVLQSYCNPSTQSPIHRVGESIALGPLKK
jgi:hypothetical protein